MKLQAPFLVLKYRPNPLDQLIKRHKGSFEQIKINSIAAPKILDTVKVVELIDLPKSKSEPFLGQAIAPTEVIDSQITGLKSRLKKI